MFHVRVVTVEAKQQAQKLLSMDEYDLFAYWLSRIAVNFRSGQYLKSASERSKRILFGRWKVYLRGFAEGALGSEVP